MCAMGVVDEAQVLEMLRPVVVVDQSVVEENQDEAMEKGSEYLVQQRLKCGWRVGQAKGHD